MTPISSLLRESVEQRARYRCEYCLIHQEDAFFRFHVDHIIAEKPRGITHSDNLCLSCQECNLYKGSDISSIDTVTGALTPLFNPRTNNWDEHFQLDGAVIRGITAIGRVTEFVLKFNTEDRLLERKALVEFGRYPSI